MPLVAARRAKLGPNLLSRSRMSYFGPCPKGVASRSGTCGPGIGRRASNAHLDDSPRVQKGVEVGKQRTKETVGDLQAITRPDVFGMRVQEGGPGLSSLSW